MREKIYFNDSKGIKLCGVFSDPAGDISRPVIILCHGFTTSKESFTTIKLEERLNKENIATFRFDFFGHGESEGDFPEITISEGVDDILRSIDYLKALGYSKIGLFGSSFGGGCSIMAASKTDDLYLLALKSPVSNYYERDLAVLGQDELEKWKKEGCRFHINAKGTKFKMNYTFFEDYANNDGYEEAKKISIPVFIIHGNKDEAVPVEQSVKISKIFPNCRLEIIDGADHRYSGEGQFDRMIELVSGFIIKNS